MAVPLCTTVLNQKTGFLYSFPYFFFSFISSYSYAESTFLYFMVNFVIHGLVTTKIVLGSQCSLFCDISQGNFM